VGFPRRAGLAAGVRRDLEEDVCQRLRFATPPVDFFADCSVLGIVDR
jgi:hypothetical protein